MRCLDVNVLLYAFRQDSVEHAAYQQWLHQTLTGPEPIGISELVLSGVVRLATNHRIYAHPSSTRDVIAFCTAIRSAPAAMAIRPGHRHWGIFEQLCISVGAKANVVPDAYHAALAIENGATWVTTDRGFARFPGLKWSVPFG